MAWSLIWRGFRQEATRDRLVVLRAPNPPPKDPTETLKKRYMLLEYIITFWACHASDFLSRGIITSGVPNIRRLHLLRLYSVDHGIRAQLNDLTFHRQTLFSIRPWLVESAQSKDTPKALPFLPLFRWAIDHDFVVFLDMLQSPPQGRPLKGYYTHECEDLQGQIHPIRRACQSDSLEAFRYFVYRNMPGLLLNRSLAAYAIAKAVSHDDPHFLSMLLEHVRSEFVDTFQYVFCEALCYHSKLGNSIAVNRLLNSGADPSLKGSMLPLDAPPGTDAGPVAYPLSWAIAGRHEAVVRRLCKPGPDTPYPGIYMSIQEPLSFALEMKDLETAWNLWSSLELLSDHHTKDLKLDRQVLVAACEHALDVGRNEIAKDLIHMALNALKRPDSSIFGPPLWHIAARGGCISALNMLAEKETPGVNSTNSAGLTPLLAALQSPLNGQILEKVFRTFINFPEVDLDFTSACGLNARDFARCHGFGYLAHTYHPR